jgi:hypothetical protein
MEERFEYEEFLALFGEQMPDLSEVVKLLLADGKSKEEIEKTFVLVGVPVMVKKFETKEPAAMKTIREWVEIGFSPDLLRDVLTAKGMEAESVWAIVFIVRHSQVLPTSLSN